MGPAEMAAVMQLCESGLDGAVATVDHQYLGLYPRDRLQRRADLVDMLHLVVENVLMLGAKAPHLGQHRPVAGRAWVGKERDAGHGLVAADRLYRQAPPVLEADVDRLDAVADRDLEIGRASCRERRGSGRVDVGGGRSIK